ncbi:acid protease [Linnemannia elongata AG-77]|uniref:Acid protease n=1 Tax=Linnemannia elongata AG-77 TaxID=1314771 RepID=A0A197K7P0_9FUNG|nr:acid protease [Linnemannia elongata AG-77]
MKITLYAPWLVLALFTSTTSALITVPINTFRNPAHLNPESLTRRYLHKRDVLSTANDTGANSTTEPFGSIQLTNIENDVMYTIPFGLGTPAQKFNVIIDTGSPITWLSSSSCVTEPCLTATRFHCESSTSCTTLNNTFSASYVSGQGVSGHYVAETYTIGSLQFRGAAGIVTQNKAQLPSKVDGIMGLWYYAAGSAVPILNVLSNNTLLPRNMIGIWLQSTTPNGRSSGSGVPPGASSAGGEITFGGVDTTKFQGEITYVNCAGKRPWSVPVGGITVGGAKIDVNGALAAIDTGTTAMLVPRAISDAINGAIPGAVRVTSQGGLWYLPCNGDTVITMTFGTLTFQIPYTHLALQSARSKTQQGDYCLSAVMFPSGSTVIIQEWLIGDVFLKNVYSVFDFGTNAATGGRLGFAQLGTGGLNNGAAAGVGGGRSRVTVSILVVLSVVYVML